MLIERPRPSVIIQTRMGNPIPNDPGLKLTDVDADHKLKSIRGRYPNTQLVRLRKMPTALYNCHGMTFFCRRGRITDDGAIDLVIRDDSFAEVSQNNVMAGDVILYMSRDNEVDHSGLVTQVDRTGLGIQEGIGDLVVPWVLSKWGDAGEYLHRFNVCPYYEESPCVKYMRES